MKMLEFPDVADQGRLYSGFYDDFIGENTTLWTTVATDSGTSTANAAIGGTLSLAPSDGTVADNDEIYFHTPEFLLWADGRPIVIEWFATFTEANTDDANIFLGCMNAPAADSLQDNGAGPRADFYGMGFYKVDGGTTWNVIYSIGTTQYTQALDGTQANLIGSNMSRASQTAGGGLQRLRMEWRPVTSAKADIIFWIDETPVWKWKDKGYGTPTEMTVVAAAKNGGANNESLDLDSVAAYQKRAAA